MATVGAAKETEGLVRAIQTVGLAQVILTADLDRGNRTADLVQVIRTADLVQAIQTTALNPVRATADPYPVTRMRRKANRRNRFSTSLLSFCSSC